MNDIGWTDAEIRASREKSAAIKDAYKRGYEKARKEFKRPQGEWVIDTQGYCHCNKCNYMKQQLYHNYCSNCGAKMKVV